MRLQRASHTCGVFAVMNALRVFGDRVSERRVTIHSGTTKAEGTTQFGILQAISRLDYEGAEITPTNKELAWAALVEATADGDPVILCTDDDDHWVTVIGATGSRLIVIDPERSPGNRIENGVHVWDQKQLFRRWSKAGDHYYGIRVSEP